MQLSAVGDIELRILNMIKKPGKLYLDILVNLVKSPFLRGKGQLNADNVLPLDFMKIGNYSSYIINWEPAASSFNSQMSETQINFQKEIKSGTQWQTPIFYYFAQSDFSCVALRANGPKTFEPMHFKIGFFPEKNYCCLVRSNSTSFEENPTKYSDYKTRAPGLCITLSIIRFFKKIVDSFRYTIKIYSGSVSFIPCLVLDRNLDSPLGLYRPLPLGIVKWSSFRMIQMPKW